MTIRNLNSGTLAALGGSLLLAACTAGGTEPAPTGGQVTVRVASRSAAAPSAAAASFAVSSPEPGTFTDGVNTLVLTRVQLVLREIELKRADRDALCRGSEAEDDDCEELELRPRLLDVPLSSGPEQTFTATVAPGSYDEIEFEIHKPEDDAGDDDFDAAFLQQHPEFRRVSVRVEGSWNGEPFTFTSRLDAEQEIHLDPALVVGEDSGDTALTLFVDLTRWFATPAGSLVDPRTANEGGANEGLVAENIRASIDAFEDRDDDGRRDGDDDSGSDS
jgi:hypothetical protein